MKKTTLGLVAVLAAIAPVVGLVVANRSKEDVTTSPTTETQDVNSLNSDEQDNSASQAEEEPTAVNEVTIKDFAYSPATITVKKGTTVTWTNQDSTAHTITSDEGSTMDSELLAQGGTYTVTFNEVGTFKYHCKPHPQMTGTVIVTE